MYYTCKTNKKLLETEMKLKLKILYCLIKVELYIPNPMRLFLFLFFEIHRSDNYGHYSDVQLVIGGGRPQTCVRHMSGQNHRRTAGQLENLPTIKSSPRPGLEPTRWRAEGFQVSDSNCSATGAPLLVYIKINCIFINIFSSCLIFYML